MKNDLDLDATITNLFLLIRTLSHQFDLNKEVLLDDFKYILFEEYKRKEITHEET